jgi:DNA polymerase III alpha subunit
MNYAELQVTSNFSFLRGASHPEELIKAGSSLVVILPIAITDRNTLAGVVRAHVAAKENGIKFITGLLFRSIGWRKPVSLPYGQNSIWTTLLFINKRKL